jgi:hypothetical protein
VAEDSMELQTLGAQSKEIDGIERGFLGRKKPLFDKK